MVTDDGEQRVAPASLEEFLQAFPAIAHELSEALTAISAYVTGSHHALERGGELNRMKSATERAGLQVRRANAALRQLRDAFDKLEPP